MCRVTASVELDSSSRRSRARALLLPTPPLGTPPSDVQELRRQGDDEGLEAEPREEVEGDPERD